MSFVRGGIIQAGSEKKTLTETSNAVASSKDEAHADFAAFEQHSSGVASKLMAKMGFTGRLGKNATGIVNPILPSTQYGKGIGLGNMVPDDEEKRTSSKQRKMVEEKQEPDLNMSAASTGTAVALQHRDSVSAIAAHKRPRSKPVAQEPLRHAVTTARASRSSPLKKLKPRGQTSTSRNTRGQDDSTATMPPVHAIVIDLVSFVPSFAFANRQAWAATLWEMLQLPPPVTEHTHTTANKTNTSDATGHNDDDDAAAPGAASKEVQQQQAGTSSSYWASAYQCVLSTDIDHLTDVDALHVYELLLRPMLQSMGLWEHAEHVLFPPLEQRGEYEYEEICDEVVSRKDEFYMSLIAQQQQQQQQQQQPGGGAGSPGVSDEKAALVQAVASLRRRGVAVAVIHTGQRSRARHDLQQCGGASGLTAHCTVLVSGAVVPFSGTCIGRPYKDLYHEVTQRLRREASAIGILTTNPYVAMDVCAVGGFAGLFMLPAAEHLWPSRCTAVRMESLRFPIGTCMPQMATAYDTAYAQLPAYVSAAVQKDNRFDAPKTTSPTTAAGDTEDDAAACSVANGIAKVLPARSWLDLSAQAQPLPSSVLSKCLAVFSEDHMLYPGSIVGLLPQEQKAVVVFDGYGNKETVSCSDLILLEHVTEEKGQ